MAARSYHAWILGLAVVLGCGGKKDEPAAKQEPAAPKPQPTTPEPKVTPRPMQPVAAPPATVDVPVVGVTVEAPGGATVTDDPPHFNETKSTGAVVAAGDFHLHLWKGNIGEGRTAAETTVATIEGGKYTETVNDTKTVEYTSEKDGVTRYGYFVLAGKNLLCGTEAPVASAEALEPYRAACKTVQPRK